MKPSFRDAALEAGLEPYAAALAAAKIPHPMFHGGLSDAQRKQTVDDYNTGKIRTLHLGPSGSEGLSLKGTRLIQLLDPALEPDPALAGNWPRHPFR